MGRCDEVDYDYTHFAGLDDIETVTVKSSTTASRAKETETVTKSASEGVTVNAWCSALCRVVNVCDVCDDARVHFVTPSKRLLMTQSTKMDSAGRLTPQRSYEEAEEPEEADGQTHTKGRGGSTLLFDEHHAQLATKTQRKEEYA